MNNLRDKPALLPTASAIAEINPSSPGTHQLFAMPQRRCDGASFEQLTHHSALVYAAFGSHRLSSILLSRGPMP